MSEKGPGPIIRLARPPYHIRFMYRKFPKIDPGLDLVRSFLRTPRCACGESIFQVHRRCRSTIDMFAGGYHYPANRPHDTPVKDGFYDDFADTVRYCGELFIRGELAPLPDIDPPPAPRLDGHRWMWPDPTEDQILAEIENAKRLSRLR